MLNLYVLIVRRGTRRTGTVVCMLVDCLHFRCTRWDESERPSMLEVVRVLENYSAPEPDRSSVLYQTLAYCEQQSQTPEQSWSVASVLRSIAAAADRQNGEITSPASRPKSPEFAAVADAVRSPPQAGTPGNFRVHPPFFYPIPVPFCSL